MTKGTKLFIDYLLNSATNAEKQSVQFLYSLHTEHMQNSCIHWFGGQYICKKLPAHPTFY